MSLDDLLGDREANAGARILVAGVQALEDDEDLLGVSSLDAQTVVRDRDAELPVADLGVDREPRWDAASLKFQPVSDEVLDDLDDLPLVAVGTRRQDVNADLGAVRSIVTLTFCRATATAAFGSKAAKAFVRVPTRA